MPRSIFTASSPRSSNRLRPGARRAGVCAVAAAAVLFTSDFRPARATSGEDLDDYNSFFAPEIIGSPQETPFFLTYHALYPQADGEGALPFGEIEAVNTKEWSAYLGGKVSQANLAFLIYQMKLPELDKLIWVQEGKRQALGKQTAALKAELDAVGNGAQVLKALYYLGFAKRCEPIALRRLSDDAWDAEKLAAMSARDAETAGKLLIASESQLARVADPFLEARYRFQRLRLMFYTGRYAEAQKYYAANLASFTTESSVRYRFIETAAGAFHRTKNYSQANYLYSLVFGRFAPLKRSAYLSFHPVEEADWKAALALAQNDRERAVLWQLLGIYADGLAAIDKIYTLMPGSPLLPLLLVRELNKAERDFSENENRRSRGASDVRADADALGKKRLALVKRIADERKAFKPYLWQLGVGHLYALLGDTKSALTYLDLADKSVAKDPDAAAQVRLSRLLARLRGCKAVDKSLEPYLAAELTWLKQTKNPRAPVLNSWALRTLSKLYEQAGDTTRALLLVDQSDASLYQNNRQIDGLMDFLGRRGKSAFDEYLTGHYSYSKGELIELKALNELYAGRPKSAAELLAQAGPEQSNQKLRADPFLIHIVDCHDCDFVAKGAGTYTKASFLAKLVELSAKAERTGTDAAQASFQLASGYYNMSYYGNARDVYVTAHGNFPDSIALNLNMQLAEKYYRRALDLSADREFKAKACFMLAKTEQNRYFNAQVKSESGASAGNEPVHSPVAFKLLKDSYANTRYYQEIVRECGYFRSYLKGR